MAEAYRETQTLSSLETAGPDLYFNKVKTREIFKVTPFPTTPVLHSTIGSGESDLAGYLTTIGIDNNLAIYGAVLKNPHLTTPDCKIEIWKIDSDGNALLFKTLEDKYLDDQGIDAIQYKRVSGITFDDDNNLYVSFGGHIIKVTPQGVSSKLIGGPVADGNAGVRALISKIKFNKASKKLMILNYVISQVNTYNDRDLAYAGNSFGPGRVRSLDIKKMEFTDYSADRTRQYPSTTYQHSNSSGVRGSYGPMDSGGQSYPRVFDRFTSDIAIDNNGICFIATAGRMNISIGNTIWTGGQLLSGQGYYGNQYQWQNGSPSFGGVSETSLIKTIYMIAESITGISETTTNASVNNITLTAPGSDITVGGVTTQGSDHEIIKFEPNSKGTITTSLGGNLNFGIDSTTRFEFNTALQTQSSVNNYDGFSYGNTGVEKDHIQRLHSWSQWSSYRGTKSCWRNVLAYRLRYVTRCSSK